MSDARDPHADCGADVAAYVLGALEPDELGRFRRHLAGCSVCQAEVETLGGTVDTLPLAAPRFDAPDDLRRRLMAEVRADAKRQRARDRGGVSRVPRYGPGPGYKPGLISAGAMLALVAVLAVVAVFATGTSKSTKPAGGASVYEASIGSGEVVVRGGHAELIVHGLTRLGSAQTYEIWLERGSSAPEPTNGLFNVADNGDGDVDLSANVTGDTKVLVTREHAGGSAVPTSAPVFAATLS